MLMKSLGVAATTAIILATGGAFAQQVSPVGLWKNIDDQTGKSKALIRITESNGEFRGKIEKLYLEAGDPPNPKCGHCDGERKDQPVIGMTILTGMKLDGAEYNGGQILDPKNGKVYKSKFTIVDGGKTLNLRGYIGMPILGRTQTWVREE